MGISFAIPIDEVMRVADQLQGQRPGGARAHRRGHRRGDQGRRRAARPAARRRRAGAQRRERRSGRARRPGGGRHHPAFRRQADREVQRPAADRRERPVPARKATMQVWRKGATRDLQVTVAEMEPERATRASRGPSGFGRAAGGAGRGERARPGGLRHLRGAARAAADQERRDDRVGRRRRRTRRPAAGRRAPVARQPGRDQREAVQRAGRQLDRRPSTHVAAGAPRRQRRLRADPPGAMSR